MITEEGRKFLKKGYALIDTSNRTKEIKERSVIAIASIKHRKTILFKSFEKKRIFKKLEKEHPKGRIPTIAQSVNIYYLLKDCIEEIPGVYICADGHNISYLRHYLQNFLRDKYSKEKIIILSSLKPIFGKKNIADRAAYKVAKGKEKASQLLEEKHFKKLGIIK